MGNLNDKCTDGSNLKENNLKMNSFHEIMKTFKQTNIILNQKKLTSQEKDSLFTHIKSFDLSVLDSVSFILKKFNFIVYFSKEI